MGRRSLRSTLSAVGVAAAGVLLAGCFSIESTISVNDDATADVKYLVLIDTEAMSGFAEMMGEDIGDLGDMSGDALLDEMMGGDDPCADLVENLAGYEVETNEIDNGGEVGVECTVKSVPLDELSESMGEDGSTFDIEQDETGTRFAATLTGVDELTGDADDMTAMLGQELTDIFEIKFTVSAPGSLGENNASSTSGSTATWTVTPDAGFVVDGDAQMTAEWTPGGGDSGSSSILWIILGIVAAVLIVGAIVFFLGKRGKGDGTDADPGTPTMPPAVPGQAPPPPPAGSMPPPGTPTAPPPPSEPPPAPPTAPPPPPPAT